MLREYETMSGEFILFILHEIDNHSLTGDI